MNPRWALAALFLSPLAHAQTCVEPSASVNISQCKYLPGALPSETLGNVSALSRVQHIIYIMQENRSFDHFFGRTGHGMAGFPDTWQDATGQKPYHDTADGCGAPPHHLYADEHFGYANGAMNQFVNANPGGLRDVMRYTTDGDHPFYSWLLKTFATSDHYFCSAMSSTWPNRAYALAGKTTALDTGDSLGPFAGTSLLDMLSPWNAATVYFDSEDNHDAIHQPFEGALKQVKTTRPISDFFEAVAANDLPPVSFVDTNDDEHPSHSNVYLGENAVRRIVQAVMSNPAVWQGTVIFITYDENGGFFEHLPPPTACDADTRFQQLGMRVPLYVVSPFAKPGYVSHMVNSHTSIMRFIEARFGLQAQTKRDANSNALFDLFNFCNPPFLTPPKLLPTATPATDACSAPPADSLFGYDAPSPAPSTTAIAAELGMHVSVTRPTLAFGIKYWVGPHADTTHAHHGHLWNAAGTLLGTVSYTQGYEVANTWETAYFSRPLTLQPGQLYTVSRDGPAGSPKSDGFFTGHSVSKGFLATPADEPSGLRNGVYSATAGNFPTTSAAAGNYWVDLVISQPLSLWNGVEAETNTTTKAVAEIGTKFTPTVPGQIIGMRYWVGDKADALNYHTGKLWLATTPDGAPPSAALAVANFPLEGSKDRWVTTYFATPVTVTPGTTYIVSRNAAVTGLAKTSNYFSEDDFPRPEPTSGLTTSVQFGPLWAPADTANVSNGVSGTIDTCPNRENVGSSYWVDPLFVPAG